MGVLSEDAVEMLFDRILNSDGGEPRQLRARLVGTTSRTFVRPVRLWRFRRARYVVLSDEWKSYLVPVRFGPAVRGSTFNDERLVWAIDRRVIVDSIEVVDYAGETLLSFAMDTGPRSVDPGDSVEIQVGGIRFSLD